MSFERVLVVGKGAREHALLDRLRQSSLVGELYATPGNAGTAGIAQNVPIDPTDVSRVAEFAERAQIDLTVIGPEDALAAGIVDSLRTRGLSVLGPTREATDIESSNFFGREVNAAAGVPTPTWQAFTDSKSACAYAASIDTPIVVRQNGLAAGKGVHVCHTREMAELTIVELFRRATREAGILPLIIEQFCAGEEISLHALCDGNRCLLFPPTQDHKQRDEGDRFVDGEHVVDMPPVQDHKRAFEGDRGPNTGGMGATNVFWLNLQLGVLRATFVDPVLAELARRNRPFTGLLYPGLIGGVNGFKKLEDNARFGDPETSVYMALYAADVYELLAGCANSTLTRVTVQWHEGQFAICVVLASGGYPDAPRNQGAPITGLDEAARVPGVYLFHAGTALDGAGRIVTAGGRVLNVVARGTDVLETIRRVYGAVKLIHFEGMQYRRDIGHRALAALGAPHPLSTL